MKDLTKVLRRPQRPDTHLVTQSDRDVVPAEVQFDVIAELGLACASQQLGHRTGCLGEQSRGRPVGDWKKADEGVTSVGFSISNLRSVRFGTIVRPVPSPENSRITKVEAMTGSAGINPSTP